MVPLEQEICNLKQETAARVILNIKRTCLFRKL